MTTNTASIHATNHIAQAVGLVGDLLDASRTFDNVSSRDSSYSSVRESFLQAERAVYGAASYADTDRERAEMYLARGLNRIIADMVVSAHVAD